MTVPVSRRHNPLWRVRMAAAVFAVAAGVPCLTLMDNQLPVGRIVPAYLAVAVLIAQAIATFVRARVAWWAALAAGPLLALAALGLAEKPTTIALGLSVLAGQSLYGSTRMAFVRSALVAAVVPVLVLTQPVVDGTGRPIANAVVPVIVLALFSMLLRLLYSALTMQQVVAARETLLAGTSLALLEAVDVPAAEAVVRATLVRLADDTNGLHARIGAPGTGAIQMPAPGTGTPGGDGTVTITTSTETLVVTGPALTRPEIRALVDTIVSQLELVRSNHKAHRELYTMAHHDLLTSLCNRRAFFARLTDCLCGGREHLPLGLMLLDLDEFKAINDTHGHAAGDTVLVEVARRMSAIAGEAAVVARFGGDEFAVLAPSVGPAELHGLAERLRDDISRPIMWGERELQVGVSIGIADAEQGQDAGHLMRLADLAMYEAKALGKNRVVAHEPEPSSPAPARS